MKNINKIIAISLLCISCIFSQKTDSTKTMHFKKGDKALQFKVSSLFSISSFQGSVFSFKKHYSPEKAVRIGLSITSDYEDLAGDDHDLDDSTVIDLVSKRNYISLAIVSQFITYKENSNNMFLYYGIGPNISLLYAIRNNKRIREELNQDEYIYFTDDRSISIGVSGVIGVEWFYNNNISFLAEYAPSFSFGYKYNKEVRFSNYNNNDGLLKGTFIKAASSAKMGISFYF